MRHIKPLFFLLMVVFAFIAQAKDQGLDTVVRKTVDSAGKVKFSKSGFSEAKPVNKHIEPAVKVVPPKITTPKVDIYYASWDPHSNKAIVFFRENHVVVNAYDIDLDPEAAARKKRIDPSFSGMPLVIINGDVIRGVNEIRYREALAMPLK
ncbi:MAG: hypothetical protein EXR80_06015 [Methylococcales bacterium]|nr:hypothetical protein [Methylococcales bacterium]